MPKKGKWLIPQDWSLDSGDWDCVEIQWPNSVEWKRMLIALLYTLTRGREWDETSGTITDVQAVGWEIFTRNMALTPCGECPECPDCPSCEECEECEECAANRSGALIESEESDMGQVVTNVTVNEQGQIVVWFGPCCSEVLTGIKVSNVATEVDIDPVNPDNDPDFVYYACGKAKAIVDAVYGLIEICFDYADEVLAPWQYIPRIEADFGFDLDNNWLTLLILNAAAAWAVGQNFGLVNLAAERARVQCQLAQFFSDDNVGVPDSATFESVKGVFKANITIANWGFFDQAINAIGAVDMNTIAVFGSGDSTATCDCPDVNTPFAGIGEDFDWRYVFDFRDSENGFTLLNATKRDSSGLWATNQITDNKAFIDTYRSFDNIDNGSTVRMAGIVFRMLGDEGTLASGTRIGTDDHSFIGQTQIIGAAGDLPANAGTYQVAVAVNQALGSGTNKFLAQLQCSHATAVSQRILAVMFAGTGPGPLNI